MAKRAPGKYDGKMHKLSKLVSSESPQYQDRVEQKKTELRATLADSETAAIDMAKLYRQLRKDQDRIKAELSACNLELEAVTQLLIDTQERAAKGWGEYGAAGNMMRLSTGDTLRVSSEPYTVAEDKDAIREYFMKNDMERLLSPPWQTLNSLNKDRLLNGEPELPGTKLYVKTGITFTEFKADAPDETTQRVAAAGRSDL